jgi:hypothetical protein
MKMQKKIKIYNENVGPVDFYLRLRLIGLDINSCPTSQNN